MKKLLILLSMTFISISYAKVNPGNIISAEKMNEITFGVGDIRHSLLEATVFQSRYGNCWKIMDGSIAAGTDYEAIKRQESGDPSLVVYLPDATGRFLRNVGGNAPSLGETQEDAFQGHGHRLEGTFSGDGSNDNGSNRKMMRDGHTAGTFTADNEVTIPVSLSGFGNPRYANETRPVNIGVNMFIKVNESCE